MLLTSLNKIIAVLIVGSIPISWVFFRFDLYASDKFVSSIGPLVGGLLFIASAIACGTAIDSITDILVRKLIVARVARSKPLSRAFGHGAEHERFQQWHHISDLCLQKLDIDPRKLDRKIASSKGDIVKRTAAALFMKEASKENFDWMASHDANETLSSNLVTCTIVIWLLELIGNSSVWPVSIVIALPLIYIFLANALREELYADMVIARFFALYCLKDMTVPKPLP